MCLSYITLGLNSINLLFCRPDKGEPRCEWVRDTTAVSVVSPPPLGYATCTADVTTCPDGVCDPLEQLSGNLTCLQDCTRTSTFIT